MYSLCVLMLSCILILIISGLGEPQTFRVDVNRVRDAPLDLYFVVDQSGSMKDTLETFQEVIEELCRL